MKYDKYYYSGTIIVFTVKHLETMVHVILFKWFDHFFGGGLGVGGGSKYLVTTEDIESDIHHKKRNTYGCFTNLQKESMGIQDLDSHVYQSHSTILQTAT